MREHGWQRWRGDAGLRIVITVCCLASIATADTVTLTSGAVIRGEIVGEDAYEVRVVVGRTAAGDIQTLKIVAQGSVAALQRGNPEVAVEADPVVGTVDAPPEPLPDASALRATIKRAEGLSREGQHAQAAERYRAVIDETERRLLVLGDKTDPGTQNARLELLQLREDAHALLLIALQGRLEFKREALRVAEESAQRLERTLAQQRKEIDSLQADDSSDRQIPRRLGEASARAGTTVKVRALEDEIAKGETRLIAHRAWAREARLGIVTQESELELADAKARRAKDDLNAAERAARGRR